MRRLIGFIDPERLAGGHHPSGRSNLPYETGQSRCQVRRQLDALVTDRQPAIGIIDDSHPLADDAGPGQTEYDKAPISETSAPDAQRSNRMDFTIGLNIGDDGKILIHIRIPEDEGFTISEAERFRDLLDKQITVARSMSDGEENMRRFRN
jgi:hypothetical protein